MTKRLLAVLVCLVLLSASGCEFLAAPSASPAPPAPTEATQEPVTVEPSSTDETIATDMPTETPTEEPTAAPTPTPDPTEGVVFPDSDTKLLKWDDLIALDAEKLGFARNEIFARKGYKFTSKKYADYFGKLGWYAVDPAFSESKFSEIQLANIHLIQAAEDVKAGKLYYVPSGTKLDFDQDGTLDTLTYSAPDNYHMNLKMKEGTTTTSWNIDCEMPSKKVYLGDINYDDGMLDLFVDEFGPSDDYAIYVSGIKHHAFLNRTPTDTLPGQISQIKPDGKGSVSTKKRMNILMTWFCPVKYKLESSGKLMFVAQSSYSMGNFKCKTKVALPLKASASSSAAVKITVPAGTEVLLVSTDDVKWIQIKAPSGTGWLEMVSAMTLKDPNIDCTEAFDGLDMAD